MVTNPSIKILPYYYFFIHYTFNKSSRYKFEKSCSPHALGPLGVSLGGARAHPAGGAPSEGAADAAGGAGTGAAAGEGRGGSHQSPTGREPLRDG